FIQLTNPGHIQHPEEVQELLKKRISHQWTQQGSSKKLLFDAPNCELQGTYTFSDRELILIADHTEWRGRLEVMMTDVLEGRSLAFSRVKPLHAFAQASNLSAPQNQLKTSHERKVKIATWLPWTLAIAGVATGIFFVYQREKHIQQLNGL